MVDTNLVVFGLLGAIVVQLLLNIMREAKWDKHRDSLRKEAHRRERELLNRILAGSTTEFAMLQDQDVKVEKIKSEELHSARSSERVNDLLTEAGLAGEGYSKDGVSVV